MARTGEDRKRRRKLRKQINQPALPTRSDLRLIAQAARQFWPVQPGNRKRIVRDVARVIDHPDATPRQTIAAAVAVIEMSGADIQERRATDAVSR